MTRSPGLDRVDRADRHSGRSTPTTRGRRPPIAVTSTVGSGQAAPGALAPGPAHDRPPGGESDDSDRIYARRVRVALAQVPVSRALDHTMTRDLDSYVAQRLPVGLIEDAVARRATVQVHGIYPTRFEAVARRLGFTRVRRLDEQRRAAKPANGVRPQVYRALDAYGRDSVLVAVPPGPDYVLHYASLVRHVTSGVSARGDLGLSVWRYPEAEVSIADWTGLDADVTGGADTVVFGRVGLVAEAFAARGYRLVGRVDTPYYSASTHRLRRRTVTLLGVHFSYWGSIGGVLAARCCDLGVSEIVYLGKLGALSGPDQLYGRLYVPSRYAILRGPRLAEIADGPRNGLLGRFPGLDSGLHVSVATVLEEDFRQRALAAALGAKTVDNELAQMALAVARRNLESGRDVRFSGLHYATDYLRSADEARLEVPFSLSRGRTEAARRLRTGAELLAADCLDRYLDADPGPSLAGHAQFADGSQTGERSDAPPR